MESTMPNPKMKSDNPNPWTEVERDIWYLGRPVRGWSVRRDPGWYFADETADMNGPFETQGQAREALKQHAESI